MINNKLVLNTSKTESLVFVSKHSLRPKPQLELCTKGVTIEQVEEAKLLGIILDGQLSWASHIDKVIVKMGRGIAAIKRCSAFFIQKLTVRVVKALVLYHLDYYPVIWSSAAKKDLAKQQLAQMREALLALNYTNITNFNNMHDSFSWLRVDERFTASLLVFMRNITVMKIPDCLHNQITFSSDTHTYPTRHAPGVSSQSPSPIRIHRKAQFYTES